MRSAVIDGEAIVIGEDGLSDFFSLHAALARKNAPRAVLVAFDLMFMGADRHRRSLRLSRFLDRGLVLCGSAGSGLSDSDARQIRAALDAKQAVIVTVEYHGFTPSGELRHPVIRSWYRG